jgi:hypothetical protein
MSDLRIEKRRVTVTVTLTAGHHFTGSLFLSGQAATHAGPERLIDLLNAEDGFVPFELVSPLGGRQTLLLNRAHISLVHAQSAGDDLAEDPGYQVAAKKSVTLHLADGDSVTGVLRVERPAGRDRLSDLVSDETGFRYLESATGILAVNLAHVVHITPLSE